MKKRKQLSTRFSPNSETYLLNKMSSILEQSIPKDISGMLALAKYTDDAIVFYERYHLKTLEHSNYYIYDSVADSTVYQNITLFVSAINMIYNIKKNQVSSGFKDNMIYQQDQKYSRCIENIKFYKHQLKTATGEKSEIIANRLENDLARLHEIKHELFKIF